MKYCTKCGAECFDEAVICVKCGCSFQTKPVVEDDPNGGWAALSFFVPIIGIILGIVWNKEKPLTSKLCLKWSIISIVVSIILIVIYVLIIMIYANSVISSIT